jgi:hypothetical protein
VTVSQIIHNKRKTFTKAGSSYKNEEVVFKVIKVHSEKKIIETIIYGFDSDLITKLWVQKFK